MEQEHPIQVQHKYPNQVQRKESRLHNELESIIKY